MIRLRVFAALSTMTLLSFQSVFAATTSTSPHGGMVVSSLNQYKTYVQEAKAEGYGTSPSATKANVALHKAAALILAKTHDPQKWADFLARHGEIVYLPPTSHDSQPNDVSFYTPSLSYDYSTGEQTMSGAYSWNSLSAVAADFPYFSGNVGGLDSMGIQFSNLPDPSNIISHNAYGYDSLGYQKWSSSSWTTQLESTGQFLTQFEGQDQVITNENGQQDYNWYEGEADFTFSSSWNDNGQATFSYSHDWSQTGINGFSFGASGSGGDQVAIGLNFNVNFSASSYQWAANSGYLSY